MITKEQKFVCEVDAAIIAEGGHPGGNLSSVALEALKKIGWLEDGAFFDYAGAGFFDREQVLTALALCITLADEEEQCIS